jgi:hypothetical protein
MIWGTMIKLNKSLSAWQTDTFSATLKNELESISATQLPLQAELQQGSHVAEDEGFKVMVINTQANDEQIQVKIGIFYASIIAGCACADDPTPLDTCNEYCELLLVINKATAKTVITPVNASK